MACASAGKWDMMNQPGHGGDVPVAKRRRCVEPAGAAAGIPEDVMEQILLRLPVKSILRFRSVCKSWRAMVADPRFVRLQLHHSTTAERRRPPSMLIVSDWCMPQEQMGTICFFRYPGQGVVADLAHEMSWASTVAAADGDVADDRDIDNGAIMWDLPLHCNGLVLLRSIKNSVMLVCNPATKELVELPACTPVDCPGAQRVGFYADQSTGKTKVVRCFIRHKSYTDYSVGCEVLSLGSPAWRPVADPPYLVGIKASPCILGGIYWMTLLAPCILRFDVCSEEFATFPSPPLQMDNVYGFLTELAGKLCYVHAPPNDKVELWTASAADEGGAGPRWSLHCTIVLPCSFCIISSFAYDYQGGIFFNVDCSMIYRYDVERGVVERVVHMLEEMTYFISSRYRLYRRGGEWMHHAIQYSESLVSVQAN